MSRARRIWAVDLALLASWFVVFMLGRTLVDGDSLPHLVPLALEWMLLVVYVTWALFVHLRGRWPE